MGSEGRGDEDDLREALARTEETLAQTRRDLVRAEEATRSAYQDTTRLIRLLTVIGTPSSPTELIDRTLVVLSEVYSADVTCVASVTDSTLRLTNSVGLPEDDPALHQSWEVGPSAAEALRTNRPISSLRFERGDLPPSLREIGVKVSAWVPLWDQDDPDRELLILCRRRLEEFTAGDLEVLASVGYRMHSAVEARERGDAMERLARTAPELARHVELQPQLREAVTMLHHLTGAEFAWVVTIKDDVADIPAQVGLPDEYVRQWPRAVGEMPAWGDVLDTGEMHCGRVEEGLLGPRPTVLSVPVKRDSTTMALLCLGTKRARLFGKTAIEVTRILSSYLGVAMSNNELYRALSENEAELRRRATHDPLTGLANRVLAKQRIEEALNRSPTGAVGVLFCDLDKFKEVNDRLGHEAGDELIQEVAERLSRFTRRSDLLARFGGDEFVVVIDGVEDLLDLHEVGQRIQAAMAEPFQLRDEQVNVSASVGGVLGVRDRNNAMDMLRDADAAMYAAKVKGPGRVQVFDEAASHRSMDRLDLRSELAKALDNGQFAVEYQPIVELGTDRLVGFEALLRWNHPRRGPIAPDVIIPMAEETGAIVPIGAWVLQQALQQLARWKTLPGGASLGVAVNMSASQLADPGLTNLTLGALDQAGVQPDDLWLEVTEHQRVNEDVTEPVIRLREEGVHFALDDFGMSYSNLSYLRSFPVEAIKVDRSFVSGVATAEADRGIIRAVLALAQALHLMVTAEGIETAEQRDALHRLGCQFGQGYFLAMPMSSDEAAAHVSAAQEDRPHLG